MGALTFLFTLLLLIIMMSATMATTSSSQTYKTYVKTACNSTTYPQICYKSLSSYASSIKSNPQKLCNYVRPLCNPKNSPQCLFHRVQLSKKKGLTQAEAGVVKDCIENIKDSVNDLKQSVTAMSYLGGADIQYQLDDIKTWVSASLTDADTCTEEFDEQKVSTTVKNTINKSIVTLSLLLDWLAMLCLSSTASITTLVFASASFLFLFCVVI